MRFIVSVTLAFFLLAAAHGQSKKPEIVGQKDLYTNQGQPITIQLTDLYVEEKNDNDDDEENDRDNDGDDDRDNDGDNDRDNADGDDRDDDDADDRDDDDDKDKGKDKDKDKDKDKEKDEDKDKDKDSGKDKDGGGNDRTAAYPQGYTLEVFGGKDYTASGATVTPDPSFTGILTVEVRVRNDQHASKNFDLKITVKRVAQPPQNKAPVITGQLPLNTKKNKSLKVTLSDLIVSDPDDKYPDGFSLKVGPGENYSVNETTVTPTTGFTGSLTVPVQVNDGEANSQPFNLKITVSEEANVAPVITGQSSLSTTVNKPITILLSHLQVTDPDNIYPSGFTIKLFPGDNYTFSDNVLTPAEGFNGILVARVTVNDGVNESKPFDLRIDVLKNPNAAPEITGQLPLSISENQSIDVMLSHLLVKDPDNNYPADFSLKIFTGENYSLNGARVTPASGFTGDLFVKVTVHDGIASSDYYELKISVTPSPNAEPVITGQSGIKITQDQVLEIKFAHLVVHDTDNSYPEDFSLNVFDGDNYSVVNNTITPAAGFLGTLSVKITVNDGKASSKAFDLKVQVVSRDRLEITGQKTLEIPEDSALVILPPDLVVNDPDNTYPAGFSVQILKGENYDVVNTTVKPHRDFSGNLTVPVTVTGHGTSSTVFSLLVIVTPVNDPPLLVNLEPGPLVAIGSGPWVFTSSSQVADVDDDHLLFAEVGFSRESYQKGTDELLFDNTENIHGVFDAETGTLFLLGRAPLEEYQTLIRSLQYNYKNQADSMELVGSKIIYLQLNDGKHTSPRYERMLMFDAKVSLEIPTAFTPNNDQANDTWKITSLQRVEQVSTFIRVYDKRGNLVFETLGLEKEWDGHVNGTPLPADVYFYTIEMDLSYRKINYKGIVSILR